MDEQMKRQRENGSSSSYTQGSGTADNNRTTSGTGIRKPHIIKPNEVEYVDFKEEKD